MTSEAENTSRELSVLFLLRAVYQCRIFIVSFVLISVAASFLYLSQKQDSYVAYKFLMAPFGQELMSLVSNYRTIDDDPAYDNSDMKERRDSNRGVKSIFLSEEDVYYFIGSVKYYDYFLSTISGDVSDELLKLLQGVRPYAHVFIRGAKDGMGFPQSIIVPDAVNLAVVNYNSNRDVAIQLNSFISEYVRYCIYTAAVHKVLNGLARQQNFDHRMLTREKRVTFSEYDRLSNQIETLEKMAQDILLPETETVYNITNSDFRFFMNPKNQYVGLISQLTDVKALIAVLEVQVKSQKLLGRFLADLGESLNGILLQGGDDLLKLTAANREGSNEIISDSVDNMFERLLNLEPFLNASSTSVVAHDVDKVSKLAVSFIVFISSLFVSVFISIVFISIRPYLHEIKSK